MKEISVLLSKDLVFQVQRDKEKMIQIWKTRINKLWTKIQTKQITVWFDFEKIYQSILLDNGNNNNINHDEHQMGKTLSHISDGKILI